MRSMQAALAVVVASALAVGQSTVRVSVATGGGEANAPGPYGSTDACVSSNGRYVAFQSDATNLAPGSVNGTDNIFLRDLTLGTTECVSVGVTPSISGDGRIIAFDYGDIFALDRQTGITTDIGPGDSPAVSADGDSVAFASAGDVLIWNRAPGTIQVVPHGAGTVCSHPSLSGDGRFVGFDLHRFYLARVMLYDRATGATEYVSSPSTHFWSGGSSISSDGRYVAFGSQGGNGLDYVYIRDRLLGTSRRVAQGYRSSIAGNGRFVAFDNVNPMNPYSGDVFLFDQVSGQVTTVSRGGNSGSLGSTVSVDGRVISFSSIATNLVPGDTNGVSDIFARLTP